MAYKIGFISQKGGVGKSTLARLVAREFVAGGYAAKIADMDKGQETSRNWHDRRIRNEVEPEIPVEKHGSVRSALVTEASFDVILFDGGPRATSLTSDIARVADLLVLPTGLTLDDMEPTIHLAHQLRKEGIDRQRIAIAFCRVGSSEVELREATDYVEMAGYHLLAGSIRESTGYGRASDAGKALTETSYPTLNEKADVLAQSVIDRLAELQQDK